MAKYKVEVDLNFRVSLEIESRNKAGATLQAEDFLKQRCILPMPTGAGLLSTSVKTVRSDIIPKEGFNEAQLEDVTAQFLDDLPDLNRRTR